MSRKAPDIRWNFHEADAAVFQILDPTTTTRLTTKMAVVSQKNPIVTVWFPMIIITARSST